jgi:hypothetical protein
LVAVVREFLFIGTVLGAAVGVLHAIHLYRCRKAEGQNGSLAAAWFALWALGLWTLFGAYLLLFWIIGAAGMLASRLIPAAAARR